MTFLTPLDILSSVPAGKFRRALFVTALPEEMQAVLAHVNGLGSVVGRKGIIYECGEFSGIGENWLVIVVQGVAGNQSAQQIVSFAHYDFDSFDVLFFVGVGASRKSEAPIGSVIAASQVYNPHSGKYDKGGFSARPRAFPTTFRVVQLSHKVARDKLWHGRIRPPSTGIGPSSDEYPKPYPPKAIVAPIASVEAVVAADENELSENIAKHFGDAYAIEMEGFGVAFAADAEGTPSLIIRGVSDMRIGKTPAGDAIHQPIAAVHAAAFGFEFLSIWGQMSLQTSAPYNAPPTLMLEPVPPSPGDTPPPREAAALHSNIVLNFEGSTADFPPERIDAIIDALKKITGNTSIRSVRSEPGSFRLVIEGESKDVAKIDTVEARASLASELNVDLVGVVDETGYRQAQDLELQIHRTSHDLLAWPRALPGGHRIERPELAQLINIVEGVDNSTTVVLGAPGSGKSTLLSAFASAMKEREWPVLAIKADLIDPTVQSDQDLQAQLNLSQTPARSIELIAALRPTLLIIDQVDALAGYLDLRTGRLTVLLNLVRQLGRRRNIHIVLSARTFEFEHDVRLKAVAAESIELQLPAWHTVLNLLDTKGVQADGWPADAQELLRSPQALSTFLGLLDTGDVEQFRTYQAMLDRLWAERILQGPDGPRLGRLTDQIAQTMAEEESLWLATARFESQIVDLRTLEAVGILKTLGPERSVGFTHQTLFEHALARAFAKGKGRLSSYVLSRQASLFVRPKLWAGLTYLRAVEPSAYQFELDAIWQAPDLRRHLRLLVIDFMGQQQAPTDRETILMAEVLKKPEDRPIAFRALAGSPGWFDRMAKSFIAEAMTRDQSSANLVTRILVPAWAFAPAQVGTLIRERWANEPTFDRQCWAVLESCLTWSEEVLAFAIQILGRSDIPIFSIDHLAATIGVAQPDFALQLVHAKLNRDFATANAEAEKRRALQSPDTDDISEVVAWNLANSPKAPLTNLLENSRDWGSLPALSEAAPASFLEVLWPFFKKVFATLREIERPPVDYLGFALSLGLDFRFEDENAHDLRASSLLDALKVATEALAARDPEAFLAWLDANEAENATPTQRIFAHCLASRAERYARRALEFLLGDYRRFYLGNSEDFFATSKRLVKAASPYWSNVEIERFETAVLTYGPVASSNVKDATDRRWFSKHIRRIRLGLLKSLPSERTSPKVKGLIAEEGRAFPDEKIGVRFSEAQFIGSPMHAEAMSRATDEEIIKAFSELPDATGWDHPRRWMVGGNIQLSRAFADFSKANPDRACRLIDRFEPGIGERAAGYALDAMAETVDSGLIVRLLVELPGRGFNSEEFRSSIAGAIERLIRRDVLLGDDIVAILEGWLELHSPQSVVGPTAQVDDGTATTVDHPTKNEKDSEDTHSVLWDSRRFSILPHGNYPVLESLTRILLARAEHDRLVLIFLSHLTRPEDPKVWQALLRFVVYLRPTDTQARSALLTEIFARFPELTDNTETAYLLAHAQWWAPDFVRTVIEQWSNSGDRQLRQAYGELVALIAVAQPKLDWAGQKLKQVIQATASPDAQVGAAYSAVNLWIEPRNRSASTRILEDLIPLADVRVWSAIFDLFRLIDELTPEPSTIRLLEAISAHIGSAGRPDAVFVINRLETLLPHEALLVAKIASGLVTNWKTELSDISTSTAIAAPHLVDLAITLHRLGPATREIGTSLFEDLLFLDAYSARQTLDEIDNRFKAVRRPARPTLPGRSIKGRRRS